MRRWPSLPSVDKIMDWLKQINSERINDVTEIEEIQRRLGLFRLLHSDIEDVGNVTTGEDDLMTYDIPAGTLTRDGQYFEFSGLLSAAANGNNKTFRIKWGSTTLYSSGAVGQNGGDMAFFVRVTRTGAASQKCTVITNTNMGSIASTVTYTEGAEDLTAPVTFKCTGEATGTDDIIQHELVVKWYDSIV